VAQDASGDLIKIPSVSERASESGHTKNMPSVESDSESDSQSSPSTDPSKLNIHKGRMAVDDPRRGSLLTGNITETDSMKNVKTGL
jgi:hypothetical protein